MRLIEDTIRRIVKRLGDFLLREADKLKKAKQAEKHRLQKVAYLQKELAALDKEPFELA